MKNLTNEEIIEMVNLCAEGWKDNVEFCKGEEKCPLFLECLHYFTGDNCGSVLDG